MKDFFRGVEKEALELLQGEENRMIRVSNDGKILAQTEGAAERLKLDEGETIFSQMMQKNGWVLQDAIQRKEPCTFTEHFGGSTSYKVFVLPTEEGALLLLRPGEVQSVADAKLQRDARNNLQGILSAIYTIKDESPSVYEHVVQRVYRVVRELTHLEMLRSAEMWQSVDFYPVDLSALCQEAAGMFRKAGGPEVTVEAPEEMIAICNKGLILRALLNLLTNAAGATHVCIRLTHQLGFGGTFTIAVEDDGRGIPPELLDRLYKHWAESADEMEWFSMRGDYVPGAGLPVVAKIVEKHRGKLTLEKSSLGGARFCIIIADDLEPTGMQLRCWDDDETEMMVRTELSVMFKD